MSKQLMIKVCGMRDAENIREVEQLSLELAENGSEPPIAMMGFIFWPHSSRYVFHRPDYLPTKMRRVGVFVDEDAHEVARKVEEYRLDMVQLHGKESPGYIRKLGTLWSGDTAAPRLIKAFNIATAKDFGQTAVYEGLMDYFLFDAKGKLVGGNGEKFEWSVLTDYQGETPFLLSGGIGPGDVDSLRAIRHPLWTGIDLNSRFEVVPGLKDVERLREFVRNVIQ